VRIVAKKLTLWLQAGFMPEFRQQEILPKMQICMGCKDFRQPADVPGFAKIPGVIFREVRVCLGLGRFELRNPTNPPRAARAAKA